MSFILDALKKSESDRQRQSGPSLFEVKVAPPRRRLPVWAAAIAVLFVINVAVISWMLLRHPAPPQPAAASTPAPAVPAMAATASAPPAPSAPSPAAAPANIAPVANSMAPRDATGGARAQAAATPAANAKAVSASDAPSSAEPGSGQSASNGNPSDYEPAVEPPAARRDAGAPQGTAGGLPLYQQIVTSAGLPPLHLDLHVYAQRPQDRFVMINMRRVIEGDSLPEGARVEAIQPDGVVLSYHGTRFLLPRN